MRTHRPAPPQPSLPPASTHPKCSAISFTGGDTGLDIARKAAMIPIQMELGGKDVAIVCADADLEAAAKHIVKGGFSYSGQRCTAVKLVLAVEGVADELAAKVVAGVKKLSVGMPEDDAAITPVISTSSANFIQVGARHHYRSISHCHI